MSFSNGPKGIVTDGLIFSADAGNDQCYTSGSATAINLIGGQTLTLENGSAPNIIPYDNSWEFDGSDDYIDCGASSVYGIPGSANLTLEMFMRKDASDKQVLIAAYNNTPKVGIYLQWATDGEIYFGFTQTVYNKYSLSFTDANTWIHCVGVYDGTQVSNADEAKIYVNGVNQTVTAGSIPDTISATDVDVQIGSAQNFPGYTDGGIGNIRIYNRSLTASEVLQNYNSQKSRFGL